MSGRIGKQGGQPWITGKAYNLATRRLRELHRADFDRLYSEALNELEVADVIEVFAP